MNKYDNMIEMIWKNNTYLLSSVVDETKRQRESFQDRYQSDLVRQRIRYFSDRDLR